MTTQQRLHTHQEHDPHREKQLVALSSSREMIAAIQAAGGHPHYTEFAGQGHGVWPYVYSLDTSPLRVTGFFSWLFSQHK